MKDYIEERAVEIATYIIENNATVRQTAKQFGISKSTVHKDVTERLLQVRPVLAAKARRQFIKLYADEDSEQNQKRRILDDVDAEKGMFDMVCKGHFSLCQKYVDLLQNVAS